MDGTMLSFSDICREQERELRHLRDLAHASIPAAIESTAGVVGVFLSGSVARGDARIGPYGVLIDLIVVIEEGTSTGFLESFGKDEKPQLPFHCVMLEEMIGLQIDTVAEGEIADRIAADDAAARMIQESEVLLDPRGRLAEIKSRVIRPSEQRTRRTSIDAYFRFQYLSGEYRFEKWEHRRAWPQIAQNINEASECYFRFLYGLNRQYVPRKDWLVYLSYELRRRPDDHEEIVDALYSTILNAPGLREKHRTCSVVATWMNNQCEIEGWL